MAFLPRRRLIRAGRPIGLTLLLAAAACWQTAWLLPQTAGKAPGASRRSALLGAAAAALAAPSSVRAFGDVKMPMSNVRWKEVQCNPDKGEMLKGTRATYGLEPRCVEVTAQVTNPEEKVLKKAGVFGKVNNIEEQTSVLANAMDGASDNGQFTLIEEIPPGTSDVVFRFVAALPKKYNNGPLPNLEFFQLKASWYPGAVRWQPLSECDLNPTADGCEEAERFCKNCQNNLSADGKPIYSPLVIAPQRLAVVPLPPKPDMNWGWKGHFAYGDTKVGDCAFREGGVFSFISVDCGLRVGDREGDSRVTSDVKCEDEDLQAKLGGEVASNNPDILDDQKSDEPTTTLEVSNCTDEPVQVKIFEPGHSNAAARLFRSAMAEGTISPATNRVFTLKASKDGSETDLDVEIRIGNKKAKCEVVGDQVIFVDGLMGDN